ncbi:hypothetical protein EPUL_000889 [Erysiphe pulchra]|uniref:RRM domain-containing protein n=1 Tax=Erysiphe pulchra TaxID=225359 RepID=A0A2S4Q1V1_9PEZI|nr:hypothetical protein EPUL_000889 [Erysiphe pulchra]
MSSSMNDVTDAINDVTATLGKVSISDNPAETDQSTGDTNKEAVLASAAEGRRLYIGNLAYATTEGELQSFFKGYSIESTSIPKNPRTDRPVGYAFVDLTTSAEAERAIAELSGQEILERKVSVQLARKPELPADKATSNGGEVGTGGGGETEPRRRRISGRGRGRGGRGRGRAGRTGRDPPVIHDKGTEAETTETSPLPAETTETTENQHATEKKEEVEPKEQKESKDQKEPRDQKERPSRPPRERRERGPPANGVPSKTKVMVANLPYDLSEEKLKELFSDYEPVSAKIALRPIPRFMVKKLQARNEPRKGRGFGFVNLASNELQDRAVNEMNGKEVEGREIAVKVAIDSPDKISEDPNTQASDGADGSTNNAIPSEGTNGTTTNGGVNDKFQSDGLNGTAETIAATA